MPGSPAAGLRSPGVVLLVLVLTAAALIGLTGVARHLRSRLPQTAPTDRGSLEAGRRLYYIYCWFCHGALGRGDGPVADTLPLPPRDFTRAEYKVRSTPHGAPPTDSDLFLTISRGLPATHMPGWHTLSRQQRWQLVGFVKSLSGKFKRGRPAQPISAVDPLAGAEPAAVIRRGRELYVQTKCWLCHGRQGRGDGPVTTALVGQWGLPFPARNLRDAASYKGGSTVADLYRTITTGFDATPMGPQDGVLSERQRWYVAYYVAWLAGQPLPRAELLETGVSWQRGRWLFFGKGRCILCHRVEGRGASTRGPDLTRIGAVAGTRRPDLDEAAYIYDSIVNPHDFLVTGYSKHMPLINREAIFLEPDEVLSLVAYLGYQGRGVPVPATRLAALPPAPAPAEPAGPRTPLPGDPEHGRQLYGSDQAACPKCHTMHGQGSATGPDLTGLASFQSLRQVRQSLLDPAAVITYGFENVAVATLSGRVISGTLIDRSPAELRVADDHGNVHVIAREQIEQVASQATSAMPTNVVEQLSPPDHDDLLAFLLDQRPVLERLALVPVRHRWFNPRRRLKNGPPLANVTVKVKRPWLRAWLRDPKGYDRQAFMPALELSDAEIEAVIAYLTAVADPQFLRAEQPPDAKGLAEGQGPGRRPDMAELLARGRAVWSRSRCTICHRVAGRGGAATHAPTLTGVAAKLRPEWLYYWLSDPRYYFPATQMPHFRFSTVQRRALTEYLLHEPRFWSSADGPQATAEDRFRPPEPVLVRRGRDVITRSRCVVCHDVPGIEEVLAPRPRSEPANDFERLIRDGRCLTCHRIGGEGGSFAPDLSTAGSRLKPDWVERFLLAPDIVRPLLEQMPKLNLTPAEARTAAEYMGRNLIDRHIDSPYLTSSPPDRDDARAGRALYHRKGCRACHQVGGSGGAIGPDLSEVTKRLRAGYVWELLKYPQRYVNGSMQPDYGLSSSQARKLTAYLTCLDSDRLTGGEQ